MIRYIALFWLVLATAAVALDPTEMLPDAEQEARARSLDHALRCVVCQSESVASSNADWAVETRRVIREQVAAGQTNAQITEFFVERYGEFVLMNPKISGSNWLLWAAGPLMLLMGIGIVIGYVRGRARAIAAPEEGLSADESKRLAEILKD